MKRNKNTYIAEVNGNIYPNLTEAAVSELKNSKKSMDSEIESLQCRVRRKYAKTKLLKFDLIKNDITFKITVFPSQK